MAMRIAALVGVIAVLALVDGQGFTVLEETDVGLFPTLIQGAPYRNLQVPCVV